MSSNLDLISNKADGFFSFLPLSYVYFQTQRRKKGVIFGFLTIHWTLLQHQGVTKNEHIVIKSDL